MNRPVQDKPKGRSLAHEILGSAPDFLSQNFIDLEMNEEDIDPSDASPHQVQEVTYQFVARQVGKPKLIRQLVTDFNTTDNLETKQTDISKKFNRPCTQYNKARASSFRYHQM